VRRMQGRVKHRGEPPTEITAAKPQ
jgi:hypothetical protein